MRGAVGLLGLLVGIASGWMLVTQKSPLLLLVGGILWLGGFAVAGVAIRRTWMAAVLVTSAGFAIFWGFTGGLSVTGWLLPLVTGAVSAITAHLAPIPPETRPSWVDGIWAVVLFFLASIAVSTTQVQVPGRLGSHLLLLVGVYLLTPVIEVGIILVLIRHSRQYPRFFSVNYPHITLPQVMLGVGTGLGASFLMALIVAAESHVGHVHVKSNNPFIYATGLNFHDIMAMVLVAAAVVLVAPITEEILFRGLVFGSFMRRWPYFVASGASALLFGLAHMDLTLLLPLTIAGILLNALYYKTRSLVPSTIAHATLNAVSVLLAVFATR